LLPGLLGVRERERSLPAIPATESALGLHPCIALSSAQFMLSVAVRLGSRDAGELIDPDRLLFVGRFLLPEVMCANRTGIGGSGLDMQWTPVQIDMKVSIWLVAYFDHLAGIPPAVGQRRQLDSDARDRSNNVILTDGPLVAKTENVVQIEPRIELAPNRNRTRGSLPEANVILCQKPDQECVGLFESAGVFQAQLAGQTVLKRAPRSFDAAFSLRRTSDESLNPQLLQSPAYLSGELSAGQFFLQRPVLVVAL